MTKDIFLRETKFDVELSEGNDTFRFIGDYDGGGSTSPAGSDTQVQLNDSGSFGADDGLTYTREGSNTYGAPLLRVGNDTESSSYFEVGSSDKNLQIRSTDTYSYIYCGSDSDFHIEHNRDPAYRTAGAKIRIGAVVRKKDVINPCLFLSILQR